MQVLPREISSPLSGHDVRLGGGISTIRQYLSAALIDDLHLAIQHLLGGLNLPALGYECVESIEGARAMHVILRKRAVTSGG